MFITTSFAPMPLSWWTRGIPGITASIINRYALMSSLTLLLKSMSIQQGIHQSFSINANQWLTNGNPILISRSAFRWQSYRANVSVRSAIALTTAVSLIGVQSLSQSGYTSYIKVFCDGSFSCEIAPSVTAALLLETRVASYVHVALITSGADSTMRLCRLV